MTMHEHTECTYTYYYLVVSIINIQNWYSILNRLGGSIAMTTRRASAWHYK